MEDVDTLTDRELERFMHVVHGSFEVRRRNQFFLWVQGQVQSLVQHEVMICAHGDFSRRNVVVDHFSSYPLPGQDVESIADPDVGLMAQTVRAWQERGERPMLLCTTDRDNTLFRRFESALFKHAFPNLLVHAMPALPGWPSAYFAFANMPQPLSARLGYRVELLLPYLHAAYLRMLGNEGHESFGPAEADRLITVREIEILQWVRDGKSNQEIGEILGISPLTVKNHVQKILKKLKVQNRAQAVAKGLALQLIKTFTV